MPDGGMDVRPAPGSPSAAQVFTPIHRTPGNERTS
jgi:hypothetical protein